jgi:hypothetical protein
MDVSKGKQKRRIDNLCQRSSSSQGSFAFSKCSTNAKQSKKTRLIFFITAS